MADDLPTGGVMLPTALAVLGLSDEYQFVALLRTHGAAPHHHRRSEQYSAPHPPM
jgi:hypothetical protein